MTALHPEMWVSHQQLIASRGGKSVLIVTAHDIHPAGVGLCFLEKPALSTMEDFSELVLAMQGESLMLKPRRTQERTEQSLAKAIDVRFGRKATLTARQQQEVLAWWRLEKESSIIRSCNVSHAKISRLKNG